MELRIKEVLEVKGIKVSSLAESVGITRANMSNIVNGKSNPSLETLERIANSIGIEIWELFTDSTSKDELTALINYKGDFYKATTILELEKIVEEVKGKRCLFY